MILFKREPKWEVVKNIAENEKTMEYFHHNDIQDSTLQSLEDFLSSNKNLTPAIVRKCSMHVGVLCQWVFSVKEYAKKYQIIKQKKFYIKQYEDLSRRKNDIFGLVQDENTDDKKKDVPTKNYLRYLESKYKTVYLKKQALR